MKTASERIPLPGVVPCAGCVRCCVGDAVRLLPGDDPARYRTEPHPYFPGQRMLAHRADGACIYLGNGACSIHPDRPQQCREMDCRLIASRMTFTQARKAFGILPVWNQGNRLLAEVAA